MAGITLAQAEAKLALYLTALDKVLLKQSYSIDGRSLTYANLADIENAIQYWDSKCKKLSRGSRGNITARSLTARD